MIWRVGLPKERIGKRHGVLWAPEWRDTVWGKDQCGGRKLPKRVYHPRIEYSVTTLAAVLMKKWPLNSIFTTDNPFYHLQQNPDGTSIQKRALGHTSGGLGCKEGGYIREKKLCSVGREIFRERVCVVNRKVNSVLLDKSQSKTYIRTLHQKWPRKTFFQQLLGLFFHIWEHFTSLRLSLQLYCNCLLTST